ncbi:hypothetical protein ACFOY4_34835 [Actinomadura syzygii]|uniref:Uncharacterized protein n=1 Tax=Actinomadura syzygii TaxID=1427538 RepID=A0A5D0UCW6_9ACTN|nr:hypothetical protein [Actinomadura syzygii]TYC16381.1 hypothetical protein FXF65_07130 [Actinomadura syzygii]
MRFEAVFVAGYALLLVGVAAGLHRLGGQDTSPWRSRMLAGHRRRTADPPPDTGSADWPHSEAGRLHTGIALVTAVAAATLSAAEMVRHHRPVEIAVLGAIALTAIAATVRLWAVFAGSRP